MTPGPHGLDTGLRPATRPDQRIFRGFGIAPGQKHEMIEKVTDTMVAIEGEAMRDVTWVRISEFGAGQWGIGGKAVTSTDVKSMHPGNG